MTPAEFRATLARSEPPSGLAPPLQALWWDARGDWERAHDCAQTGEGVQAAAVHAYLHRREGDPGNAGYWYRRAGRPPDQRDLAAEWEALARELLGPH